MPTLRLPLLDAKLMAAALIPLTDEWRNSALGTVAVGHPDSQFAVASNRYVAGRYDLTNVASIYPETLMLIPVDLLSALLTIGPKTLIEAPVQYDASIFVGSGPDGKKWQAQLTIALRDEDKEGPTHYMRVFNAVDQTLAFPPIARLFDQWVHGEEIVNPVVMNSEYLARFTTYARRVGSLIRLSFPRRRSSSNGSDGVLVEVGTRFKGIIMPYLTTYNDAFGAYPPDVNAERIAAEAAATPSQDTDSPETPDDTVSSGS